MSQTTAQPQDIKLFQKWTFKDISVQDIGLQRYLNLTPMVAPHSMGRHEHQRFRKAKVNIVERLINSLMRSGKNSGKKAKATNIVKEAFEIINLRTGKNPIEILVKAVENASPCEDTTRVSYGGVVYHLSVDVAPQRRIDLAIRHISEGARAASINNPRSIQETLADELVLAANKDIKSAGIAKRNEIERVAQSSR
ncbi:MAG: 30S ribosomal protein S7 [Candidatus Bathyarchaeia archaeon]|jgi:small subunit ribosomal protein S7